MAARAFIHRLGWEATARLVEIAPADCMTPLPGKTENA
jgi:hypothetical protein